ncbi:MAG: hypothetical protein M3O15_08200 [Acidobacteriota bacterium]|nr:hypothetical protein [Acidobacteriota bacterium]
MKFHLERGLRLHTEPEYKSLYRWAINEIDAQGQRIGHDQIPWDWTLHFTGTSCVLRDSIDIKSVPDRQTTPTLREVVQRQVIVVRLSPGRPWDGEGFLRSTTFSMFGADRTIKNFELDIYPIANPAEQESCTAWGAVSGKRVRIHEHVKDDAVIGRLVREVNFGRVGSPSM